MPGVDRYTEATVEKNGVRKLSDGGSRADHSACPLFLEGQTNILPPACVEAFQDADGVLELLTGRDVHDSIAFDVFLQEDSKTCLIVFDDGDKQLAIAGNREASRAVVGTFLTDAVWHVEDMDEKVFDEINRALDDMIDRAVVMG